jgi:hypothetical protein
MTAGGEPAQLAAKPCPNRCSTCSPADPLVCSCARSQTPWTRRLTEPVRAGDVLAALVGAGRAAAPSTSSLYRDLETTEKSGVSYRLGMAFAAIASEYVLDVPLLEHLNRTNSTLAPGSRRRADLYGIDPAGKTHVVEAKSRTYGFTAGDVRYAKSQSLNVNIVHRRGRSVRPSTRAASLTDLSTTPISVLLADPAGEAEDEVTYVVDLDRLIQVHYSAVPDLIEVHGGPQPPPASDVAPDVVGAFLPGTDIWLGIDAALLEPTPLRARWVASHRCEIAQSQPQRRSARQSVLVQHGRVGDSDDRALRRLQPGHRLTPRLLAWRVQQLVAGLLELSRRRAHRRGVFDVELDADLRHRSRGRPLRRSKARLGGLRQRPDAE